MIRVGFIGVGMISPMHLRYLQKRRDVKIAALCDINQEILATRRKEFGGKGYTDFRAMLATGRLDSVWVCTPPDSRREPLLACAQRGIPVFCEKPVERSATKARAIAAELAACKANVQIGYVFRSMPIVQQVRAAIQDDRIHLVQSFYGCGVSLDMGLPAWFYDQRKSGGALVDQATHNLDLLRSLIGEVKDVQGLARNPVHTKKPGYTIDETIALSFAFANGVVGSHIHTWVGDAWRNEIMLSGEKRVYRLDLGRGILRIEGIDGEREFRQNQSEMYEHQNAVFLKHVATGNWTDNPCTYADGARTLALTLACSRAVNAAAMT